ncbi:MAG: MiaB/RimO family radical SAM methylthiotransferase, partial [SAR324 cluster bacterium]|nr:MiaB/RimO family radical SAM methylthiotransferase [SAR324 cluster bacterium]
MPALHTAGRAKVYVETLGCSKNRVDSEIMLHHLSQNHYTLTLEPQEADAIVVNTCAFLTSATEESVQRILELSEFKETGRCSTLVAAGCLSQRYREDLLKELPELDALLGSQDFSEIVPLLDQVRREPGKQHSFVQAKPHYQQFEDQEKQQSTPRHFAYVKIAEGCSNMCSFCNIPMLRGLLSSRSVPSIVHEIQQLVSRGVKEINLISQDTSSFGRDRGQLELAELLRSISALEGDFWVRLFYCYPNTFTDEALAAFAGDKRFCAYLDMPFQHIEDNVLRKMNRKITRSQIEQKMQEVKRILPEVAWRTTFIVGFP